MLTITIETAEGARQLMLRDGDRIPARGRIQVQSLAPNVEIRRSGDDLVLVIRGDGGASEKVVIAGFYTSPEFPKLELLSAEGATEIYTPNRTVAELASVTDDISPAASTQKYVAQSTALEPVNALLAGDLHETDSVVLRFDEGSGRSAIPDNGISLTTEVFSVEVPFLQTFQTAVRENLASTTIPPDLTPPEAPVIEFPKGCFPIDGVQVINRKVVLGQAPFAGKTEPYSVVTLTITDAEGHAASYIGKSDGSGSWQISPRADDLLAMANGLAHVVAQVTDMAGNAGPVSQPVPFELRTTVPAAPSALRVDAASDHGLSQVDNITNDVRPVLTALVPLQADHIRIYTDLDADGVAVANEFLAKASISNGVVNWQPLAPLANGTHAYLFTCVDRWLNESSPAELNVTIDTEFSIPLALDAVAGDNKISYQETQIAGGIVPLSGKAETGAHVDITVTQGATVKTYSAVANAEGDWSLSNFDVGSESGFVNGGLRLSLIQTDIAGNVSVPLFRDIPLRNQPVPEVTSFGLLAADDTGVSATDRITSRSQPTLVGTGLAGMAVEIYLDTNGDGRVDSNDTLLGRTDVQGDGKFQLSLSQSLTDGRHQLLAVQLDTFDNSVSTTVSATSQLRLQIDTLAKPVALNPVAIDDIVVRSELESGVALSGKGEPGASVELKLEAGSVVISVAGIVVDSDGNWATTLNDLMARQLGNGTVKMHALQTDVAGNVSAETQKTFILQTGDLPSPGPLSLASGYDTGIVNNDNLTRLSTVTLVGTAQPGGLVRVFRDVNDNGTYEAGEFLGEAVTDATGNFSVDVNLLEGANALRAMAYNAEGQVSAPGAMTRVILDTQIQPVTDLVVASDNRINLAEYGAAALSVTGRGEVGARVNLSWSVAANPDTHLLTQSGILVDSNGNWTANLTPIQRQALIEGAMMLSVSQTDAAGNTSVPVSHSVFMDITPPSSPSAANLAAANAYNTSLERRWNFTDEATRPLPGLRWIDLYEDSNGDGIVEEKIIEVAVALPANGESGSMLAGGDYIRATWGSQTLTQAVSVEDLSRGYVLLKVPASLIVAYGPRANLSVGAVLVDAMGNESSSFVAATNIAIDLIEQPPTLSILNARSNLSNPSDTGLYTNQSMTLTNQTLPPYFQISGKAEPASRVSVFLQPLVNGVPSGERVQIGFAIANERGEYSQGVINSQFGDGAYLVTAHAQVAGGVTTASSVGTVLVIDSSAPVAPTIDQSVLSGDDRVNAFERSAGVSISGSAEPYAEVVIQLTNMGTGVSGTTRKIFADKLGHWNYTLSVVDFGQVGEGQVRLKVFQTDLAGNDSTVVERYISYDATVQPPILDSVGGDGYLNAAELASLGNQIVLQGNAEPGSQVFVTLRGAGQPIGPLTAEIAGGDGRWAMNLSQSQVAQLGQGIVTVELSQRDLAGNVSGNAVQQFTIDTVANPPVIGIVSEDDIISAVESQRGISIRGSAEPNAHVQITLLQGGLSRTYDVPQSASSTWEIQISPEKLQGFTSGVLEVRAQQTDPSGNVSSVSTRSVSLQLTPLEPMVVFDKVSGDNKIEWSEQQSGLVFTGSGPAGAKLFVELSGVRGAISFGEVLIGNDGHWSLNLAPAQFSALGQGAVSVRGWAIDEQSGSSTLETRLQGDSAWIVELTTPSPTVSAVSQDNLVNALEASQGLQITGEGVPDYVVYVSLKGANNYEFTRSTKAMAVGSDGHWSITLTEGDILALGQGEVTVSAVQRTSPTAENSLVSTRSFTIDTVPPNVPDRVNAGAAALALSSAYNLANSALSDHVVTLAEATAGVQVSIPLMRYSNGDYDLHPGDRVILKLGTETVLERVLATSDFNGSLQLLVTIDPDSIARLGSGLYDVAVQYADRAGNITSPLSLVSGVNVTAPPLAPQINTISSDGFLNASERAALTVEQPLVITGTASGNGTMTFVLINPASSVAGEFRVEGIPVSGGVWQVQVPASDLDRLGEGRLTMQAIFLRADGATSRTAGSFMYDRTAPSAPAVDDANLAAELNAVSELAGGLIRVGDQITEAARPVRLRVAVPENAEAGDSLVIFWGNQAMSLPTPVSQLMINDGYVLVTVPVEVMTAAGDSENLQVRAQFTDRAGNSGTPFLVWSGKVDALPPPPTLSTGTVGEWLNDAEASAGWRLQGVAQSGAKVEVTLIGTAKTIVHSVDAVAGEWVLSLDRDVAAQLGEGIVNIRVLQRDSNQNASPVTLGQIAIDLTAPAAPQIGTVQNPTYAMTQAGVTYSGTAEANAVVKVTFSAVGTSITKQVVADNNGRWAIMLAAGDFAALSVNNSAGIVNMSAVQADVAGNISPADTKAFQYSTQVIEPPVFTQVTGLGTGSPSEAVVLNSVELAANGGHFNVSGTNVLRSSAGLEVSVKLGITILGLTRYYTTGVDAVGHWSISLTPEQMADLGQGMATMVARTETKNLSGVMDESLPATYMVGAQSTFTIDTVAPVMTQASVSANGLNGNAKEGDTLRVVVTANESLNIDSTGGTPTIQIRLVQPDNSNVVLRTAVFDAQASAAAGLNKLVFSYRVVAGDEAIGVTLDNLASALHLNGAVVTDMAGNPAMTGVGAVVPNTLLVDTVVPGAPAIMSVIEAGNTTPGGSIVNISEASADARVLVSLAGAGAVAGDTIRLMWGSSSTLRVIDAQEVAAGMLTVRVPSSVIGNFEGGVNVTASLTDRAGNVSPASSPFAVTVDTIAPAQLTVTLWEGDNRINQQEAVALQDLTGSGVETGAQLEALYRRGGVQISLNSLLHVNGDGTWRIAGADLAGVLNNQPDGEFQIEIVQRDTAGNTSPAAIKNYYIDRVPPAPPTLPADAIPVYSNDRWINRLEANSNPTIRVNLAGTGAVAGDAVIISGLPGGSFSRAITAGEISAGYASVSIPAATILQAPSDMPLVGASILAYIEDQGGNRSASASPLQVSIDTNIVQPTVNVVPGLVAFGVSPTQAAGDLKFTGGNIESGANVVITFTGFLGEVLRVYPTINNADGTYSATLTASDFRTLGSGFATYEVVQTDPAQNVSSKATGAFNIELVVSPPEMTEIAEDNIINASEVSSSQKVKGTGTPGSTINVKIYDLDDGQQLMNLGSVVVNADRTWELTLTSANTATLLNGGTDRHVKVSATASMSGVNSEPSVMELWINSARPTLLGTAMFTPEANTSGVFNGYSVDFTERVKVSQVSNLSTAFTLPTGKTWGSGARVVADPETLVTISGVQYASGYRIYTGTGSNLKPTDTITAKSANISNILGAAPSPYGAVLFDANGDGANNDGFIIRFTEPVRVADILNLSSTFVLPSGKTWGAAARVEAMDSQTLVGAQFATEFRIYFGTGSNLVKGNVVTVLAANIQNAAGNKPLSSATFTVPDLSVPTLPQSPSELFDDNRMSAEEASTASRLSFVQKVNLADLKTAAGGTVKIYYDDNNNHVFESNEVVSTQALRFKGLQADLTFPQPLTLEPGRVLYATFRVTHTDGSTENVLMYATGNRADGLPGGLATEPVNLYNPDSSDVARQKYTFTAMYPVELRNVSNIQFVSANVQEFLHPDHWTINRVFNPANPTTMQVTLVMTFDPAEMPRLTAASSSLSVYSQLVTGGTYSDRWMTVTANSVQTVNGAPTITYTGTATLTAAEVTAGSVFSGNTGWYSLGHFPTNLSVAGLPNSGLSALTTSSGIVVSDIYGLIAGTAVTDTSTNSLAFEMLKSNGVSMGVPVAATGFSSSDPFKIKNASSVDYTLAIADGLAATREGRSLYLYMDGHKVATQAVVPNRLVMTLQSWEGGGGTPPGNLLRYRSDGLQPGQKMAATARITFNDNTTRDVLLEGEASMAVYHWSGTYPRVEMVSRDLSKDNIDWANVKSVVYLTDSFSNLSGSYPYISQTLNFQVSVPLDPTALSTIPDGVVTLTAQLENLATGRTSLFSLPKRVMVDRGVEGVEAIKVLTDTGTVGQFNAGDVIEFKFAEKVLITANAFSSEFGTLLPSALSAVAPVNGYSDVWRLTLPSDTTLHAGQSYSLRPGFVMDQTGNLNDIAPITVAIGNQIFDQPGKPILMAIDNDNIIGSRTGTTNVGVKLSSVKAGDVVHLYVDGREIEGAAITIGANAADSTVNFSVANGEFGGDGIRMITASITRGGGSNALTQTSQARELFMAANTRHWSQVYESTYWFDPNTITIEDGKNMVGQTWTATAGGTAKGLLTVRQSDATAAARIVKMTDPLSGQSYLYYDNAALTEVLNSDGSSNFVKPRYAQFVNSSIQNQGGFVDLSMFMPVAAVAVNTQSFTLERYAQWDKLNGVTVSASQTGKTALINTWEMMGYDYSDNNNFYRVGERTWLDPKGNIGTVNNALSIGNWSLMLEENFRTGATVSSNGQQLLAYAYPSSLNYGDPNDVNINLRWAVNPLAPAQLFTLGGAQRVANGGQGILADQVVITFQASGAGGALGDTESRPSPLFLQELQVYLAAKHYSTGAVVTRDRGVLNASTQMLEFDLATSSIDNGLLDQVLKLNDAVSNDLVRVAGLDYVAAGAGDDRLVISDLSFRYLDGGAGSDTLVLANNYDGRSAIVLSDYTSNMRGASGLVADDQRVNAAGYHQLLGLETIDLSGSTNRQTLTVAAADVAAVSDTGDLSVILGRNDILLTQGFGTGVQGVYQVAGQWFDHRYSNFVNGQEIELFSRGGDMQAEPIHYSWSNNATTLRIDFDHALFGNITYNQFSVSGLNAYTLPTLTNSSVAKVDLMQGLQFGFANSINGPIKLTYNGTLADETGRGLGSRTWLIGRDAGDTLNAATSLTATEQEAGVVIMGGLGNDELRGGLGQDTIIGGIGSDTLYGGAASDVFRYANEVPGSGSAAGLGGLMGDSIMDFSFGKNNPTQADRLDLSLLFDQTAIDSTTGFSKLNLTGNAAHDAASLANPSNAYMDIIRTVNMGKIDWQIWVDRDGGGTFGLLTTLRDVSEVPDSLSSAATSQQLIERMLEQGRLVVV